MNPIERPGTSVAGIRLGTSATAPVAPAEPVRPLQAKVVEQRSGVQTPTAGDAPPVDADRVAEIRKAVEQGRYPVVPAKIADAMIAAGYLLRTKQ